MDNPKAVAFLHHPSMFVSSTSLSTLFSEGYEHASFWMGFRTTNPLIPYQP
jgi:hypothetical protein